MLRQFRIRSALSISVLCTIACPLAWAGPFDDPGHDPLGMVSWADAVDEFLVGPMDVAMPELGDASFGLPANALGPASNDAFDIVSLGDGGSITLAFSEGIGDGPGDDFAIWENGFYTIGGLFAELAFVEISTDGLVFIRFPATSLQLDPLEGLVPLDPSDYHGLAGDQPLALGTGFDLFDLINDPLVASGDVDLDDIRYVRLIDVIGDGTTVDHYGAQLFDPYPTPTASGGFDLEAIGVIHEAPEPALGLSLCIGVAGLLGLSRRRAGSTRCSRGR